MSAGSTRGCVPSLPASRAGIAQANGASIVEAYPVNVASPSYRHMGFVPAFEKAGVRKVGRTGKRRHVMQLRLK